jgi:hypothetical protein
LARDEQGTLWIHDYKTSARKLSEDDARNEDQLALYQVGLLQNQRYGAKEKYKLLWHFVAFEKDQVTSERSPKELEWLKKKYISKIETIEKAKTFPTKTGILCKWCEYLTVCSDGKAWVKDHSKNGEEVEGTQPAMPTTPAPVPAALAVKEPSELAPVEAAAPMTPGAPRKRAKSAVSADQLRLF